MSKITGIAISGTTTWYLSTCKNCKKEKRSVNKVDWVHSSTYSSRCETRYVR